MLWRALKKMGFPWPSLLVFFFIIIFILSIIVDLQHSVNFYCTAKWPSLSLSHTHTHTHTHSFSHIILHHCPLQVTRYSSQGTVSRLSLLIHSKCNSLHLLTTSSQPSPAHSLSLLFGNHKSVFHVHELIFCGKVHLCWILDSRYKWYHTVFVFLFLTYFI